MLLITDLNFCQQKKLPLSALICVLPLNCRRLTGLCDTLNEYKYMELQGGLTKVFWIFVESFVDPIFKESELRQFM